METEITIEIFNQCSGSCTGCMLSLDERKLNTPSMSPKVFKHVISELKNYGESIQTEYRPVFVFGDFPAMDTHFRDQYLDTIREYGLKFGTTLTMVQDELEKQYFETIDKIINIDNTAILDYTIDPFRMLNNKRYVQRLQKAVKSSPKFHMQVLLSEALLDRISPEDLSGLICDTFGEVPTTLGFTPTLSNMERKNYRFNVTSASDYTERFFNTNSALKNHLKNELIRFQSQGSYQDFLKYGFHIGSDSAIYPVSYTIFGDVILDRRNGGKGLGKILNTPISSIVNDKKIEQLSKLNDIYMNYGSFNCGNCEFYESCKFNGIGLIRKLFKEFEHKTGSCYGPTSLAFS